MENLIRGEKKSPIKLCLARHEGSRVNNKSALPVITVDFRKWASPPSLCLEGVHRYSL